MDQTRHPIHQDAVSLGRCEIEDDVPALTSEIAAPVVVTDDNSAILGVASGGNERAAAFRNARRRRKLALAVVPSFVIAEFEKRIECDDIPEIQLSAPGLDAIGDA